MYFSRVPNIFELLNIFTSNKKDLINEIYTKNNQYKIVSKSSWSLAIFCNSIIKKKKRKINLVVPGYYCNYALRFINLNEVNVIYCDIKLDDTIDLEKLEISKDKIDILISVNYFGKKCTNSNIFDFCKTNNIYLVEDSTHCILPPSGREYGDVVLYSPYKFIGTLSGAILLINHKGPSKIDLEFINDGLKKIKSKFVKKNILSLNFLSWFLKKIIQNIVNINIKIERFEDDTQIDQKEKVFMDKYSEKLFKLYLNKIYKLISIRKKSFLIWQNLFYHNKIKNSQNIFDKNFNPYSFIIEDTHQNIVKLYNKLKSKNFPVSTWPDLSKEIKENQNNYANYLRKIRLFLPIHSLKNLEYINLLKNPYNIDLNNTHNKNKFVSTNLISLEKYQSILNELNFVNLLQTIQHSNSKKVKNFLLNVKYYEISHKKNIIGAFQILNLNFFFYKISILNRGPLYSKNITTNDKIIIINHIIDNFKNKKFHKFICIPEITLENLKYTRDYKLLYFLKKDSWNTNLIDLSDNIENIKINFSSKIRNALNKNFKDKNIKIKKDPDYKKLKVILNLLKNDQRKKNYKGLGKNYILSLFKQNCIYTYYAQKDNVIIGCVIVSEINDTSTYLCGYFNQSYKFENLGYRLLFLAISESKKRSIKFFDMGGLDYINNLKVARFKNDFGGNYLQFIGKAIL
ncbi:hypothetical protein IDH22_00930 [Pelagibacterales bacterium SAG-MED35]|nr:hypothetical protein [Pelagibacterales bacterium SAG-MED35]